MAGNPEYQSLDPQGAPGPVTPADGPGDSAGFAMVTPHGRGTAPYDIQADNFLSDIAPAFDAANALTGSGVLYPMGPRQRATQQFLDSPQGFSAGSGTSGYDIPQGWSGEPDESFVNNAQPATTLETPIQGQMGTYPADNTYQPGLQKYGTD